MESPTRFNGSELEPERDDAHGHDDRLVGAYSVRFDIYRGFADKQPLVAENEIAAMVTPLWEKRGSPFASARKD